MRARRWLAAFLLVILPLTAGCWDRREIEENAFVCMLGVDSGHQSIYSVTAMIALPSKMAKGGGDGGGGGTDEKPYILTTVEAPTIASALSMLNQYIDRRVSLIHMKALLMSEDLAKISGLRTMDEFVRFRQSRRAIHYVVVKGAAKDFLQSMKSELDKDPTRFIEEVTYSNRYTGMIPSTSKIHDFVRLVNTGYAQPLTYYAALAKGVDQPPTAKQDSMAGQARAGSLPRTGGPNIEMVGAAAFKRDKMVGTLTGEEMRLVSMLRGRFKMSYFSIRDPKESNLYVSLTVQQGRPPQIQVDLSGSRPRITAKVSLEAELLALQSGQDYTDPERQGQLEQALKQDVESGMRSVISKTQGWDADVIGFGREVVRQFATVPAWEAYNWPDRYGNATVNVQATVRLRRFGLQLSPPASTQ